MSSILISRIATSVLALVCATGLASAAGAQVIECQYVTGDSSDPDFFEIISKLTPGFNVFVVAATTDSLGFPRKATGTADTAFLGAGDIADGFYQAEVIANLSPPDENDYICATSAAVRGNGVIELGDESEILLRANSALDGGRRLFTSLDCIPGDLDWDGRVCSVHRVVASLRFSEQDIVGERFIIDSGRASNRNLFDLAEGDSPGSGQDLFLICECLSVNNGE